MSDILWLVTPQHTGTHFVRHFLELHPDVSYLVHGWGGVPGTDLKFNALAAQYHTGRRDASSFARLALTTVPEDQKASERLWSSIGLGVPVKKEKPRYRFFHTHGGHLTGTCAGFKMLVNFRNPLLSIISALRRNPTDMSAYNIIKTMKSIRDAAWEKDAFKFCIDRAKRETLYNILRWLGLPMTEECLHYIETWPTVNATSKLLAVRPNADLLAAKAQLLRGEVHPLLIPWVEKLRESGLQPYFERLGYRNLPWFA